VSRQLDTLRAFTATRPRARRQPSHVIIVAGGKGGTGITTVSTLLALGATRTGSDVLMVDAAQSGSPAADLFAPAVTEQRDHDSAFIEIGARLTLADRPADHALTTMERRSALRRAASRYGDHDVVVVDAGSSAESVAAAIGAGAGVLIAVTQADRLSAAATYALVKFTAEHHPDLPVSILVNQCDPATARIVFDRIAAGVSEFLGRSITPAGQIPDDDALRSAIETGLSSTFGEGPALEAGRLLAERLMHRSADTAGAMLHLI